MFFLVNYFLKSCLQIKASRGVSMRNRAGAQQEAHPCGRGKEALRPASARWLDPGGLPSHSCCSPQPRSVLATTCRVLPQKSEHKTAVQPIGVVPRARVPRGHTQLSQPPVHGLRAGLSRQDAGLAAPGVGLQALDSTPGDLAETSQLRGGRAEAALDQRVPGAHSTCGLYLQASGWNRELGAAGAPTPGGENVAGRRQGQSLPCKHSPWGRGDPASHGASQHTWGPACRGRGGRSGLTPVSAWGAEANVCTHSEESNMSPPRTPLHIVKPALGSPWLALTIHTGLSGSAEAILKQAAWEGEQRRDSQSLSALRAMALLAPESRGPHGAGGLLQ